MKAKRFSTNRQLAEIQFRHSPDNSRHRQRLAGGNPLGYRHRQPTGKTPQTISASQPKQLLVRPEALLLQTFIINQRGGTVTAFERLDAKVRLIIEWPEQQDDERRV
jgi:hypothetical protein